MPAERDLLTLQRRVFAALREPIFDDSRARSHLPPREGAVSSEFVQTANDLIAPSATLSPVERLELYHRQYWYRLLDSLAEDFPALRKLLGEEAFWRLIEAYLEEEAPTSYTLRHLGQNLARFIATRADLTPQATRAEDLAKIEYAICAAFEAGEATPVPPADLAHARIRLQPHICLLALRTSADVIWRASLRGRPVPKEAAPGRPRFVVVYRERFNLRVERLPRPAFAILEAIARQASLEHAMEHVANQPGLLRRSDANHIQKWFSTWTSRGWLAYASEDARESADASA